MCEGPHDVAFLSRLLCSASYEKYTEKLISFPYPLNLWFSKNSRNLSIEDLSLERMYDDIKAILPSGAMYNPVKDHLVLLYSMNGDARREERKKLITELCKWTRVPNDEKEYSLLEESNDDENNFGLIVIFDADDKGISTRIKEAQIELSEYFPLNEPITENGDIVDINENIKIGIYIFGDSATQKGTLENILLPLMKQGNEKIFDDADEFLHRHFDETRLKSLILKKHPENGLIEIRDKKKKYNHIKSVMGVVGQLQNSGTSNTVCIEKADYLTLNKFNQSAICQEILSMFTKL